METVIADCESVPTKQQQRQYFNDVKTVLPAVFELLHTLFNDKAHYTKALTGAVLVRLAKLSSVSLRSFTVKGVLAALRNVVPTLFSQSPGSAPTSVYYCRDQVLAITLKHFPEPPAVDVALRLLFEARVHNASWESLSKTVLPAALCLVGPSGLRCVKSFEDVWRMCSLWEAVSPAAVTAEKEAVRRQLFVEHRTSTLPKVGSGKSLMESVFGLNKVLCVLGVPWLVHFMTVKRNFFSFTLFLFIYFPL